MTSRALLPLTSLRFFAAVAVVIYHLDSTGMIKASAAHTFQLFTGVSFFYVLSGFILQHSYAERMAIGYGYGRFMAARIARIWPLHIVVLVVVMGVAAAGDYLPRLGTTLLVAALMQSWFADPKVHFALNSVSWSLSNELFFYALFPLATYLLRRTRLGFGVVGALILPLYFAALPEAATDGIRNGMYAINPLARLPEFLLGMLMRHFASRWLNERKEGVACANWWWTTAEVAAIGSVLALNAAIPALSEWVYATFGHGATMWFYSAGTAPAFALLVFVFSISNGMGRRLLSWRPLVILGEVSFGLYLVHQPLMFRCEAWGIGVWVYLALTLAVSFAGWRLIELPAMAWARKRLVRSPAECGDYGRAGA